MLAETINFSNKKTLKQALYFYVGYIGVAVLLGGGLNEIAGKMGIQQTYRAILLVAPTIMNDVMALVLNYILLKKKNLTHDLGASLTIIATVVLTIMLGIFFGLLPATYLTTVGPDPDETTEEDL